MRRLICLCSLSLALVFLGTANAQNTLAEVVTVKVRPGMNPQFEEFIHALAKAARQQSSKSYWRVAQSMTGAPTYTLNVAMSGWADMANPGPQLEKAFGKDEAARLGGLAAASVESLDRAFYTSQPDLSNPPAEGNSAPAAVVFFDIALKPGMEQQYVAAARKTNEASKAVLPNAHYIVMMPGMGAKGVRVVGIVQSWSDLDKPIMNPGERVIKHFGQDQGNRIVAQANGAISNITATLHRTRPDLSYRPE